MRSGAQGAYCGPRVACLLSFGLFSLWLTAWWSLGVQLLPLLGAEGILPLAEATGAANGAAAPLPRLAELLAPLWAPPLGDFLLLLAVATGLLSCVVGLTGLWSRLVLLYNLLLYGLLVATSRAFLPSLGDKLLLEVSLLLLLWPLRPPAGQGGFFAGGAQRLLGQALLVKLYGGLCLAGWLLAQPAGATATDTGLAAGRALQQLLQDTPLPTLSGWYVAHLPLPLLQGLALAGAGGLALGPLLALGPRAARLLAALILTALQFCLANLVGGGLFSFVAVLLHLVLLDDGDVVAMERDLTALWPPLGRTFAALTTAPTGLAGRRWPRVGWLKQRVRDAGALALTLYLAVGLVGLARDAQRGPFARANGRTTALPGGVADAPSWRWLGPYSRAGAGAWRVHPRVQPIFEVLADGRWHTVELWHAPGDPKRAPHLVVPHQPRLDTQLSVAGQTFGQPATQEVVHATMRRLCRPPPALLRLIRGGHPGHAEAVRLHYDSYRFADWAQHADTGAWWRRAQVREGATLPCPAAPPPG